MTEHEKDILPFRLDCLRSLLSYKALACGVYS